MTAEMVIVDTSAWIQALRKRPDVLIRDKIKQLMDENRIAIVPLITVELLGGVNTENEYQRLKNRLNSLKQVQLTKKDWEESARNAYKVRRKGITVPYIDIIIGTVAVANSMTLLTVDRHFRMLAEEINLKLENVPGMSNLN